MEKVIQFARKKHQGQFRKNHDIPYIAHPIGVANILKNLNVEDDLIKVAYLHDVLEDTEASYEEIKTNFGERIANLVLELTNDPVEISKLGKTRYLINKINKMSSDALTIKLADRLNNVEDIEETDAKFRKYYVKQTHEILEHLERKLNKNQRILYELILKKIKEFI
ncbi:MAG: HD domain-containing protein [Candidatus Helarchaeota archaeon]